MAHFYAYGQKLYHDFTSIIEILQNYQQLIHPLTHSRKTFVNIVGYDGGFEPTYASESAAAIITMVLQHTDNGCK